MVMERAGHRNGPSPEPDRGDTREIIAETPAHARRPRKARRSAGGIDLADVHREPIARYPKIGAKIAE